MQLLTDQSDIFKTCLSLVLTLSKDSCIILSLHQRWSHHETFPTLCEILETQFYSHRLQGVSSHSYTDQYTAKHVLLLIHFFSFSSFSSPPPPLLLHFFLLPFLLPPSTLHLLLPSSPSSSFCSSSSFLLLLPPHHTASAYSSSPLISSSSSSSFPPYSLSQTLFPPSLFLPSLCTPLIYYYEL